VNLGPLAFVALVPFLATVRAEGIGWWRRYTAAFLGGAIFSFLALKWIRAAHPMMELFAWPGLSLYCTLFWPLTLALLRRFDRLKWPLLVTFPAIVVAFEYFRAHFPTGFAFLQSVHTYQLSGFGWYFLGYTQHANLPLRQAADLGGVYIVSAAVAVVNVAVYEWAMRISLFRRAIRQPIGWRPATYTHEMFTTAYALGFALLLVGYGGFRLIHKPFELGPNVAAMQGDVPQDEKNKKRGAVNPVTALDAVYRDGLAPGAARQQTPPDLIIWPETCWSDRWLETVPGVPEPEEYRDQAAERRAQLKPTFTFEEYVRNEQYNLADEVISLIEKSQFGEVAVRPTRTHALVGLNTQMWDGTKRKIANSALLVRPDRTTGGRYDKMHLVPFGEYVPFRETFPLMKKLSPYDWDYSCTPGEEYVRFQLPVRPKLRSGKDLTRQELIDLAKEPASRIYRFGVLICYEDSDPYQARQYNSASGRPDPVDFLVNISNDGWFTGTEQHEQHLAICRFRAIEARRSVVRAVNMGISAIVDSDGRIVALPVADNWAASKGLGVKAIVSGEVPLDTRDSPYAFLGDWVPALAWLIVIVGLVKSRKRKATT